ncbi:MAG: hypothetical protein U0610_33325 [bacterium]
MRRALWRWEWARLVPGRSKTQLIVLLGGLTFTFVAAKPSALLWAYIGSLHIAARSWGFRHGALAAIGEYLPSHGVARDAIVRARYRADWSLMIAVWALTACGALVNPFSPVWGDDGHLRVDAAAILPSLLLAGGLGYSALTRTITQRRDLATGLTWVGVAATGLIDWLRPRWFFVDVVPRFRAALPTTPLRWAALAVVLALLTVLSHRSITSELVELDPTTRNKTPRSPAPRPRDAAGAVRSRRLSHATASQPWRAWAHALIEGGARWVVALAPLLLGLIIALALTCSSRQRPLVAAWICVPSASIAIALAVFGNADSSRSRRHSTAMWEFVFTRPVGRSTIFAVHCASFLLAQLALIGGLAALEIAIGLARVVPLDPWVTVARGGLTGVAGLALGTLALATVPEGRGSLWHWLRHEPFNLVGTLFGSLGAVALTILASAASLGSAGAPCFLPSSWLVALALATLALSVGSSWTAFARWELSS